MKKGIHPNYHRITVVKTNGDTFETMSTWGKEGDRLQLDVDPETHAAWTGKQRLIEKGKLAEFNSRFSGLGKIMLSQDAKKQE